MTKQPDKSERALRLREQGLEVYQIAARIGSTSRSTSAMILQAKRRRDAEAARLASDVREIVAEREGR